MTLRLATACAVLACGAFPGRAWADPAADAPEFFAAQIAPLLETRCLSCHHGETARGGLSLETRERAFAGGDSGPALVAGRAAESLLVDMVAGDEPAMPQDGPRLTEDQVAGLRQWIDAGAVWPAEQTLTDRSANLSWWSLVELKQPDVPAANAWCRTPIDAFVAARLAAEHLEPAPEAGREALLRRLTFDLHGLPPSPAEIDAFVADRQPDAYERVVDRLLQSPRYGERWAQHWLDVVHYGDTHGYDKDKRRNHAWRYRDWVIAALNRDLPYGDFITQQLAGDVLAPDNPQARVATGFISAGPWDFVGQVELGENTVEKAKTLTLDRDDMVAATMGTFCSVTAHCARCHDHPFDPITQRDYYRLQAVFAGVGRADVACPGPEAQAAAARLRTTRNGLVEQKQKHAAQIERLTTDDLRAARRRLDELHGQQTTADNPWDDERLLPSTTNGYHSAIEAQSDATKWVQIDLGAAMPIDLVRLVPARPTDFADTPGFGFPVRFRVTIGSQPDLADGQTIADETTEDYVNPGTQPVHFAAAGAVARYVRITATRLWPRSGDYCFALAELQVESSGRNVAAEAAVTALDTIDAGRWHTHALVDGQGSRRRLPELTDELRARLANLADRAQQRAELGAEIVALETGSGITALRGAIAEIEAECARIDQEIEAALASEQVYAVRSREPRPIFLLVRGNVEQPGEAVGPGALAAIAALPATFELPGEAAEGQRRLSLARWIADPRNPLTWRSIANRVWQYHFGRGLVDTPNDFGRNGSKPTHPELLDWLAAEFRDHGQSLKELHRLIVTSAVYRQASTVDEAKLAHDADNRWLSRANRRRLDAEELRDSMLATSGRLELAAGGPGYDLFRFKDDHSPVYDYASPEAPKVNRRSVYRFIVRSVPNPFFEVLDCADPSALTPKRNTTITALQALALLNDPFVLGESEHFGALLAAESPDLATQVRTAVRRSFGRAPRDDEARLLEDYARQHGLAAMCRLLLNANEFVFVD
ncbi:MAG: DUF1553 domain-containing protein [Pirellulales bacterium]|nr:DUF1553 domain-containing protein [Pirellulales bacterium]